MAAVLWAMGLFLLLQDCLCSGGPCEAGTFLENPKSDRCARCTQCVGAQVYVQPCTATTDTKCGCKEGLTCGNAGCSFCVKKCDRGQEPAEKRSCRPCPRGTFNDQVHQQCKPWRTKCPNPKEHIVTPGDALTDARCAASVGLPPNPKRPDPAGEAWPFVLSVVTSVLVASIGTVVVILMMIVVISRSGVTAKKVFQKKKEEEVVEKEKTLQGTLIIDSPTDGPRTLIAIECSFHEAEQEQGSSSESLASTQSSARLLA
ncbi:tumor necrosis factor receptor superfamily member 9a isoform 2-T2 [Spinachia spinachia]